MDYQNFKKESVQLVVSMSFLLMILGSNCFAQTTAIQCGDLLSQLQQEIESNYDYNYIAVDYTRPVVKVDTNTYAAYGANFNYLDRNSSDFSVVLRTRFSDRDNFSFDRYDEEEFLWTEDGRAYTKLITWGGGFEEVENALCYTTNVNYGHAGYMTGLLRGVPVTFAFTLGYFG